MKFVTIVLCVCATLGMEQEAVAPVVPGDGAGVISDQVVVPVEGETPAEGGLALEGQGSADAPVDAMPSMWSAAQAATPAGPCTIVVILKCKDEAGRLEMIKAVMGPDGFEKTRTFKTDKGETACIEIDGFVSQDDGVTITFIERFISRNSHEQYVAMRKETGFFDAIMPLLSEEPQFIYLDPMPVPPESGRYRRAINVPATPKRRFSLCGCFRRQASPAAKADAPVAPVSEQSRVPGPLPEMADAPPATAAEVKETTF